MTDFMNLCLNRQSCRNFDDRAVEYDKLLQCVEAARLAPSACNSQPWRFVVAHSPHIVCQVAECGQQLGINSFLSKAQAFIVVLEEHAVLMPSVRCILDSQYFAKWDLGGAIVQICLEATAQGLGSCIIGLYDRAKLSSLLEIPLETQYAALIAIGYPADDKIRPKARKPMDELVRFV